MKQLFLGAVVTATIALALFFLWDFYQESSAPATPPIKMTFSMEPPLVPESKPPLKKQDPPPSKSEFIDSGIAIPLPDDPLHIELALYPELGKISIEKYSDDSKPTGQPLASGTKVYITAPRTGERILFRVP